MYVMHNRTHILLTAVRITIYEQFRYRRVRHCAKVLRSGNYLSSANEIGAICLTNEPREATWHFVSCTDAPCLYALCIPAGQYITFV